MTVLKPNDQIKEILKYTMEEKDMIDYFINTAIPNWHIHMISPHLTPLLLQKVHSMWHLLSHKSKVGFLLALIQPPQKRFPLELKPQAHQVIFLVYF